MKAGGARVVGTMWVVAAVLPFTGHRAPGAPGPALGLPWALERVRAALRGHFDISHRSSPPRAARCPVVRWYYLLYLYIYVTWS
jgi:hypothetical protein